MADRGLAAEIIAELEKNRITVAHLLYFGFTGSPDYFVDGRYDLFWNGRTYTASGDLLEIPEIRQSSTPSLDSISIKISGVNQTNIYKVLTENFAGVPVTVHRVLLTEVFTAPVGVIPSTTLYPATDLYPLPGAGISLSGGLSFVGEPFEIFSGIMGNPSVAENPEDGTSEVTWTVTSSWADFERNAGRRTNDSDQQKWYPGDKGLEFASQSIAELKWGST